MTYEKNSVITLDNIVEEIDKLDTFSQFIASNFMRVLIISTNEKDWDEPEIDIYVRDMSQALKYYKKETEGKDYREINYGELYLKICDMNILDEVKKVFRMSFLLDVS